MQWTSVGEFFAMGGYALYVWGSVGACAAAMALEPWLVARRHRAALNDVRMQRRLSARRASRGQENPR
ncbi:heme exporter protein CcmD [Aquabacterium humicola]|uniref:heme exporter protein CcmD n=1 Tax=Aquabacterium humicola TaxID=3237377 RepID=UPI00254304BB|nr:heme exporter protein CcmD [Rubrivivax pictus]